MIDRVQNTPHVTTTKQTKQRMKFSLEDFFDKYDQICIYL